MGAQPARVTAQRGGFPCRAVVVGHGLDLDVDAAIFALPRFHAVSRTSDVERVVLGGGLRLDFSADAAAAAALEASGQGLGPGEAAVVARWLGAAAAVVAVDLSDNSLFGTREEESQGFGIVRC